MTMHRNLLYSEKLFKIICEIMHTIYQFLLWDYGYIFMRNIVKLFSSFILTLPYPRVTF